MEGWGSVRHASTSSGGGSSKATIINGGLLGLPKLRLRVGIGALACALADQQRERSTQGAADTGCSSRMIRSATGMGWIWVDSVTSAAWDDLDQHRASCKGVCICTRSAAYVQHNLGGYKLDMVL